ncbi:GNAT family N-acetyltransferase [Maritalea sp.]|jgi:ribosomal protein S18 acetylase RimI-like enzyme|uniref:GNAT family N-acetyltransferase n=1 Tax=Maritalea sp. TaxID=2003361 RepID=UPI0039E43DF7
MSNIQNLELCWQVEAACAAAWPAEQIQSCQGFEFRQTVGTKSRRINSVNPTFQHQPVDAKLLDAATNFYAACDQNTVFRVPEMISELDNILDLNHFDEAQARTKTLLAPTMSGFEWQQDVQITTHPEDRWLQFALERADFSADSHVWFRQALLNIGYPILFAHIEEDQELAAIAYAVVIGDIAIVESVETAPKFRRQGRAAKLLSSLLAKCKRLGATKAALQVVAQNTAARALYKKLGFSTELYDYHYRTKPIK